MKKNNKPIIALFPAHPAQLWMMYSLAPKLQAFADVIWILRSKDCMLDLADRLGLDVVIISTAQKGLWRNGMEMATNIIRALLLSHRYRIDLWLTKYGAANIAARLVGSKSISFNDDDADIVPIIAWTSYPFANTVLVPTVTRMGRFAKKAQRYPGFHELFYLHPNRFTPDPNIYQLLGLKMGQPYAIVRLSGLGAHHDIGICGMQIDMVKRLVAQIGDRVHMVISSEEELVPELKSMQLSIPVDAIHHALAFAKFLVGDSQTMAAEAAVLGTPAIRISDFCGRLSTLDELESYGLAYGFRPNDTDGVLPLIEKILQVEDDRYIVRRNQMLQDKIDPVPWFVERIHNVITDK